jgi:F0F1-type ATP synthase membrane subunit c/vacuolar-type H+-ATPase subunit K
VEAKAAGALIANRSDISATKAKLSDTGFPLNRAAVQTVFVLQGGGALGAFEDAGRAQGFCGGGVRQSAAKQQEINQLYFVRGHLLRPFSRDSHGEVNRADKLPAE